MVTCLQYSCQEKLRLQSMRSQRVGHNWVTEHLLTPVKWEKTEQVLLGGLLYIVKFSITLSWFWRVKNMISQLANLVSGRPLGRQYRICLSFPTEEWGSQDIYPPTFVWLRVALSWRCYLPGLSHLPCTPAEPPLLDPCSGQEEQQCWYEESLLVIPGICICFSVSF